MEEANAFQENVLAYPAITLISSEAPKNIFKYTEVDDVKNLATPTTVNRPMPQGDDWTAHF